MSQPRLSRRQVDELPVLNRRFTNFQLMTPGVSLFPVSLTAAQPENPQGSYRMLVNGQSFAGVSHLLDGTDNHDAVLGWIVINPTLESVTEAKVTTADFDAEFGTSAAARGQRADEIGHERVTRKRDSNSFATIICRHGIRLRSRCRSSGPMAARFRLRNGINSADPSAVPSGRISCSTLATIRERGVIRAVACCCGCPRWRNAPAT